MNTEFYIAVFYEGKDKEYYMLGTLSYSASDCLEKTPKAAVEAQVPFWRFLRVDKVKISKLGTAYDLQKTEGVFNF